MTHAKTHDKTLTVCDEACVFGDAGARFFFVFLAVRYLIISLKCMKLHAMECHAMEWNGMMQESVYLSRDGGVVWNEILTGPHAFSVGDHGGLLVAATRNGPTKTVRGQ